MYKHYHLSEEERKERIEKKEKRMRKLERRHSLLWMMLEREEQCGPGGRRVSEDGRREEIRKIILDVEREMRAEKAGIARLAFFRDQF